MIDKETCPICSKNVLSILMENHHYIPRSRGGTVNETIRMCGNCHDLLHYCIHIDNISNYRTADSIKNIPEFKVYIDSIQYKNPGKWNIKKILSKLKLAS